MPVTTVQLSRVEAVVLAGAIDMWSTRAMTGSVPAGLLRWARQTLAKIGRQLAQTARLRKDQRHHLELALMALAGDRKKAIRAYFEEDEMEEEEDDRELVMRVKYKRERGLIYFLDEDGDIGVRRNLPGRVVSEKVHKVGLARKKGWLYVLDKDCIYRMRKLT